MKGTVEAYFPVQKSVTAADTGDLVTILHAGCFRCGTGDDIDYGTVIAHSCHNDHGHQIGKDKVKDGTCRHYGNPRPDGSTSKGSLFVAVSILSHHQAGTAKWKQLQRIPGSTPLMAPQSWSHAKGKFRHRNPAPLRQEKMSQLMEQHKGTENNQCKNDTQSTTCSQSVHRLPLLSPESALLSDSLSLYVLPCSF